MKTLNDYRAEVERYESAPDRLPDGLRISVGPDGLSTWYAPFEYINKQARIVLCGITPGLQQAGVALTIARDALAQGESIGHAQMKAKATASFAGVMRANLTAMLNSIEVNRFLGIESCSQLFGERSDLVHYTSALRYPVLKDGGNYSGDSKMIRSAYLWDQIVEGLSAEVLALPDTVWVPLGPDVGAVFEKLISLNVIDDSLCLLGLPHASGANAERIKYFLGEKPRELLSSRTNAQLIDERRHGLIKKLAALASRDARDSSRSDQVTKQDLSPEARIQDCRKTKLSKEPTIFAKVARGKNKGNILRPHRHPRAENRYVVSKTRFEQDYVYLDTLAEIPQYMSLGYGLRMSIPDSDVGPSLVVPKSITVE